MTIFDGLFPVGLGTTRLPVGGVADEEGIELSCALVLSAIDAGVDYIDTAHTYAKGQALEVLRRAFSRTKKRPGITLKIRLDLDRDADGVMRRAEQYLQSSGIEKLRYLYLWSLFSFEEYRQAMQPGGLYDGARRLKDEGIVEHICCSLHTKPDDAVRILDSGAFEAATISFSLLNSLRMKPVLDAARARHIGLAAMNPLGGGIIPQNEDFFSFAKGPDDRSIAEAALRFLRAVPEIQLILSGASSQEELRRNLESVSVPSQETGAQRLARVSSGVRELKNFCTGCGYCAGCPVGIPISSVMTARNSLLFREENMQYADKSRRTQENISILGRLSRDHSVVFEASDNPCVKCGKCERACTQRLPIIEAVADTYNRAGESGFSWKAIRERLDKLLHTGDLKRVGLYPGGVGTQRVLEYYRRFFGTPSFELLIFDSNPAVWGTSDGGIPVHSPDEIPVLKPDCILITNYKFRDEIYRRVRRYESSGIRIEALYRDTDVPWMY